MNERAIKAITRINFMKSLIGRIEIPQKMKMSGQRRHMLTQ
jgi:hypothetical protein